MKTVPSWVGQAVRRGILTSRYPRAPASTEEVPETSRPPERPTSSATAVECPVGAIETTAVDQGKCIRCARCVAHGFSFSGPVEATRSSRSALVAAGGRLGSEKDGASLALLGRSLHIFLVDAGSCGACNLEVLALSNPYYDLTRLGMAFTNSPRHADVLLVVGVPTPEMLPALRVAYEALPVPKAVVAVGACPISGGAFAGNPELTSSLADVLPVDLFVPGCPPSPVALLDALLRLTGRRPVAGGVDP